MTGSPVGDAEPVILKLGGSVVTEKDEPETVDVPALDRAARSVAAFDGPLVLVHGGGSFGHHHAEKHGVSPGVGSRNADAVYEVHDAMRRLNDAVVGTLQEHGVPALPVHPLSAGSRDAAGTLAYPARPVETMVGEGFVPVLHGDGVVHADEGVTILSGDELTVVLARMLGAARVGLCSTVPGVLDANGNVIQEIAAYDDVADTLGGSEATDVTGGMAGKVRSLLSLDASASIFDLDALDAFLDGASPGTQVG